jgi:two-component sensor histidine kinase
MNRESDHRLMNGLQMVSSLLSLQSREAQNATAAEQLKIAANRVATIGACTSVFTLWITSEASNLSNILRISART